jgi:hypothetical protein
VRRCTRLSLFLARGRLILNYPDSFPRFRLQQLFLVVVLLKVGCSVLAWYLGMPWSLGFWIPLTLLLFYVLAGFARDKSDISDERFGDSCYYLGFIFTISSIATSLLDVPQLDQEGKLKEIAVRFGAAMVSTFLGFIVRAYVAGFKSESDDTAQVLEDRLIAAANDFRVKLELAAERFGQLDLRIQQESSDAVARVQLAIEQAGKASSEGYAGVLESLVGKTKEITEAGASDLAAASKSATASLSAAAASVEGMVNRADAAVGGFAEKLERQLSEVRFPQEIVVEAVRGPMDEIRTMLVRYAKTLEKLERSVDDGASGVSGALGRLEDALTPEGKLAHALAQHYDALGNLIGLGEGSQALGVEQSRATLNALSEINATLATLSQRMEAAPRKEGSDEVLREVSAHLKQLIDSQRTERAANDAVMNEVSALLKEVARQQSAANEQGKRLADAIDNVAARSRGLTDQAKEHAETTQRLVIPRERGGLFGWLRK